MRSRYIQNKKIIHSKVGEEFVMMDIDSGFYFGLNSVGSVIWNHLEQARTLNDLVIQLITEYNVDKQVCERETKGFLNQLLEKNLIKVVE
jgi:hypothetical protein